MSLNAARMLCGDHAIEVSLQSGQFSRLRRALWRGLGRRAEARDNQNKKTHNKNHY
jgi:hypothetical protein